MFGVENFYGFLLLLILVTVSPGPSSILVFSSALRFGKPYAYRIILGSLAADVVLIVFAALGINTLFKSFPFVFASLKVFGALYLAYLGVSLLINSWRVRRRYLRSNSDGVVVNEKKRHSPFGCAFMMNILNVQNLLFFWAFFSQFIDASYMRQYLSFCVLGILTLITTFVYYLMLVYAASKAFAKNNRYISESSFLFNGLTGGGFVFFAIRTMVS